MGPWLSGIVLPGGVSFWSFAALGNSGIKTPYDVKPGMKIRMTIMAEEPMMSAYALTAWAQVNPDDIIGVPGSGTGEGGRWLMDGKIDIALCYITSSYWFEVSASPYGLSVMTLDWENDPEGKDRFMSMYPWSGWGYATGNLPEAEGLPMVESLVPYVTRFDTDPELIYRLVKWSDENYDRFGDAHPWAEDMTIDNLIKLAEINYEPIHDGGVRYLKEIGRWTDELDARRQYNIEKLTLWVDTYQKAIEMADDQGIDVDPQNDEWQEFWENYRDSLNLPLLITNQGPGIEQPSHKSFYGEWLRIKPDFD